MRIFKYVLSAMLACSSVFANDMVPGKSQSQPILIKGGTVHTVASGVKANHDVLFVDGKITMVAPNISQPANAKVISAAGKHVYPGIIVLATTMGLTEVDAVRATDDRDEVGSINPEIKAHIAYNTDSEIIPTVRTHGITHAQVMPSGGSIIGQSSIMNTDAWNFEDALLKASDGMHLNWPRMSIRRSGSKSADDQRKDIKKSLDSLDDYFVKAQDYYKAKMAGRDMAKDIRLEAMSQLFSGKQTLYVHADDKRQMTAAIDFAEKFGLKLVLAGAYDAWKMTDILVEKNIPVIYSHVFGFGREDEAYSHSFQIPKMLDDAGVTYALTLGKTWHGSWNSRNTAFAAGQTVAFGVDKEKALESITLTPAKILGVDNQLGSIEVGKSASLFISSGDALDYAGHKVEYLFIDGREVDLDNRHRQMARKYRQR